MDKINKTDICCLTHFRSKDTQRLKEDGWEKIFHANGVARVAILTSHEIDFKKKDCNK